MDLCLPRNRALLSACLPPMALLQYPARCLLMALLQHPARCLLMAVLQYPALRLRTVLPQSQAPSLLM